MKVQGAILQSILQGANSFGVNSNVLLSRLGLKRMDETEWYPWETGVRIWELATELSGYRFISLSMGRQATFAPLGWVAPLTSSSQNLREAWNSFCEFSLLMGDMYRYELEISKDQSCTLYFSPNPAWTAASPFTAQLATEHAMSLCLSLSAYLSGKPVQPLQAAFSCAAESKYQEYFGSALVFDQEQNYLRFDAATALLPVVSANALMYRQLHNWCQEQLESLQQQESLQEQLLAFLYRQPAHHLPKLEEAAQQLRMGPRTLQRKLKEEGSNYQKITETYRQKLAVKLLQRPDLQIQDIAYMLGFHDPDSFRKSFRRQTGQSPLAFRNNYQ